MSKEKGKAKAAKGAKGAAAASGDQEDTQLILNYINTQNRPFNYLMIFSNLHQKVAKTQTQKILDSLVASGRIAMKENGKAVVYYARQDQFPIPDKAELAEMDAQTKVLNTRLQELVAENKQLGIELQRLESALTDEEIEARILELQAEKRKLHDRLERLGDGSNLITEPEKNRIESSFKTAMLEWKKRKKLTDEIMSTLSEGFEKKTSEVREMLGIDTDESANVSMDRVMASVTGDSGPATKKPR